jgi:hypothetical protein
MMRHTLFSLLLAALLAVGPGAAPTAFAEEVSEAEQRVFETPHLDNLPAAATLRYQYRKNEAGQAAVEDDVVLTARRDDDRGGRFVHVDYLQGERHLMLPDIEQASSNPLILYFLEADVRSMRRQLGGQENYFRRRIRLALAEAAQVQDVAFSYGDKMVQGTRVEIRPYANDALQERFRGMAGKAYRFTLSPQVPGGVYELRTQVADPAGSDAPLLEEILTLRDDASGGAPTQ